MKPKRKRVQSTVRVNAYVVIARAVEEGVAAGYRRAHKYTETPTEETIRNDIEDRVMGCLLDVLDFGGDINR